MRQKIALSLASLAAALALSAGVLVALGYPGNAAARDPDPPPGMPRACRHMDAAGMEGMHQGMMNGGGQMGEWMASGEHCAQQAD